MRICGFLTVCNAWKRLSDWGWRVNGVEGVSWRYWSSFRFGAYWGLIGFWRGWATRNSGCMRGLIAPGGGVLGVERRIGGREGGREIGRVWSSLALSRAQWGVHARDGEESLFGCEPSASSQRTTRYRMKRLMRRCPAIPFGLLKKMDDHRDERAEVQGLRSLGIWYDEKIRTIFFVIVEQ